MDDINEWMWLVKTNKGDFFITVVGKWTQEEAATRVGAVCQLILKSVMMAMIPRKRSTGPDETQCTVYEHQEEKELGFRLFAGKKVWEACGRGAEFDAELILQKSHNAQ